MLFDVQIHAELKSSVLLWRENLDNCFTTYVGVMKTVAITYLISQRSLAEPVRS